MEGLKQRIITAVILLLVLAGFTVFLSPFQFALFITLIVLAASWEWGGLMELDNRRASNLFQFTVVLMLAGAFVLLKVNPSGEQPDIIRAALILLLGMIWWCLAFVLILGYPSNKNSWNDKSRIAVMGLLALVPTWTGVVILKYLAPQGELVLALVIMVAAVDVGAYFAGNQFGKRKLAPNLSPNKSWEGVWGGVVTCVLVGVLFTWLLNRYLITLASWQVVVLMLLAVPVAAFAVVGDLVESMLKRNMAIKDSGQLLPGHGGLLDRVDGLLAATPVFVLIVLLVLFELGQ